MAMFAVATRAMSVRFRLEPPISGVSWQTIKEKSLRKTFAVLCALHIVGWAIQRSDVLFGIGALLNVKKSKPLKMTSMTGSGSRGMLKLLKEKYGCKILSDPKLNKKSGMWEFTYTDKKLDM